MAQLHLYLPKEIEQKARDEAARRGLSVSQFLARVVRTALGEDSDWPRGYFEDTFGRWEGGVLERPSQGEFESRDGL